VKVFNRGHSIGTKTMTYNSTSSEVTTGIIQILLHQLGVMCDLLLVRRHLPSVDELDTLLSDVFQNDTVTTLSFEKFLESYRFLRDTGTSHFLECSSSLTVGRRPTAITMSVCLSVCVSVANIDSSLAFGRGRRCKSRCSNLVLGAAACCLEYSTHAAIHLFDVAINQYLFIIVVPDLSIR